jgi:hypothetical protein
MFFLNNFESSISFFFVASVQKEKDEETTDLKDMHHLMVGKKIKNCNGSNFYTSIMLCGSINIPACQSNLVWIAS